MNRQKKFHAALTAIIIGMFGMITAANAQQTGDEQWAKWWYGLYGGANYNIFSGSIPIDEGVPAFDKGSGLGLALGGVLEYNPGKLLGFNLMVGYDNRSVTFDKVSFLSTPDTTQTRELIYSPAYLTIEPNLRVNLGNRFFHLMVGPSFGINVAKNSESTQTTTPPGTSVTSIAEMQNVRSFTIGAQLGVGYDIPLAGPDAQTQILLTPFAQFRLGFQNFIDPPTGSTIDFKENTIRAGIALKFGSRPTPPPIDTFETPISEFTVRAPNVIAGSRQLNETFPLRNYIFFDEGSTEIPARYKRVSSSEASNFREEQLIKPSVETGGQDAMTTRSRRQMEVYYQGLNVFGDRLRRNPSATIRVIGSGNGNTDAGKKMAENVKNYLMTTFGIDAGRITTDGRAMPLNRSGSASTRGDDKSLVDAENNRVEIVGTPIEIMKPVNITSVQEEPIDNDVVFTIPGSENAASWTIEVTERGGDTRKYGPYSGSLVARVDSKELLGAKREGRFSSVVTVTTSDGRRATSSPREFRLVRADPDENETGTRYSILFEFDESKTVETYEDFLVNTVAPEIPNKASVIIHGHTDVTGEPEYNNKLSQSRSDVVQKILTGALTKAGKTVTFDTYGFGEDERRSPFNNTLPEQRYYNRTVVIEIVPER